MTVEDFKHLKYKTGTVEPVLSLILTIPFVSLFYLCLTLILNLNGHHSIPLLKTFAISIGFTAAAVFLYKRTEIFGVAIFGAVASIIVFSFIPIVLQPFYWALSAIFFLSEAKVWQNQFLTFRFLIQIALAGFFCLMLIPYFSQGYSQPFNEALLFGGLVNKDTLFHIDIAAMFKNYQVISHGMHGLGLLQYHFGSHIFIAGASNITGLSIFDSYSYFYVFFCVPLLLISILSFAEELRPSTSVYFLFGRTVAFALVLLGTGIFKSGSLLDNFAVWPSFFISESYAFSLVLIFALLSILLVRSNSFKFSARLIIISSLIGFITVTKISSGVFGVLLISFWAAFANVGQRMHRWIVFILSAFVFVIICLKVSPISASGAIKLLSFIKVYVKSDLPLLLRVPIFLIMHFSFAVIGIFVIWNNKILVNHRAPFPNWYFLALIASTLLGMLIILSAAIPGGSAYYFSNVPMFIGLPVFVYIFDAILIIIFRPILSIRSQSYIHMAGVFLVGMFIIVMAFNTVVSIASGAKVFLHNVRLAPINSRLAPFIISLRAIRSDPASKDTVVYIPKTEGNFWKSLSCNATSYFIPAISERPALYAWPDPGCYDYGCSARFHAEKLCLESQKGHTDQQLLKEAQKMGFLKVVIVTSSGVRSLQ